MTVVSPTPAPVPLEGPVARPDWLRRALLDPLVKLLKAGLSPGQLALTVGLGAALGVAPTFGLTTLIATGAALRLRLNVAALQLVCHLLTPVQLLLLLPLLRYGGELLGQGNVLARLTLSQLQYQVRHEPLVILHLLWRAELGALLIWVAAAVPVVALLYLGLRPVFQRVVRKHEEFEALKTAEH